MIKRLIYKLLNLSMCLTVLTGLNAQINDFKLSDFKLADYKRQGIDIDFNLSSQSVDSKNQGQQNFMYKNMNFSNSLVSNYFMNVNSRKHQVTNNAGLTFGYYFNKYETDSTWKAKSSEYYLQSNVSSTHRFYNPKEYFLLLSVNGNMRLESSKYFRYIYGTGNWQESGISQSTSYNIASSGNIGAGKGRIEPVEDARQAIYILDELKKTNKLKREPSNDEILEFSKRISELKNERALDYRLKKMDELNKIDSFLFALDLIEKSDMSYFSRLNDMWDFGGLVQRNSGFMIQLSYNPYFYYHKTNTTNTLPNSEEIIDENNTLNHDIVFSLICYRPFKQKFQSNFNYSLLYFNNNYNQYSYRNSSNGISSNVSYSFGIYPNTRTSMNFGLSLAGSKSWNTQKSENSNETYSNGYFYSIYPTISINYYFSPNLKLYCAYNTNAYHKNNFNNYNSESKYFSNNLEISLKYSIF